MAATRSLRIGFFGAAILGLGLYVWAALAAPVVLWSDSRIDMDWARTEVGIFRPIPPPPPNIPIGHLPKPGYLIFLRLAMRVFPLGEERSIVLVQSVLLWLSIVGTSCWLARRRGAAAGLGLAVFCLSFLRLRDASSAVMSEALAAAFVLPIAAFLLDPPRRWGASAFLGLAAGALFLVRPNCGGAVLLLAVATFAFARESRRLLLFVVSFAIVVLPFWYAGRSNLPGDPLRGLGYQIVEGSADYYWTPSISPWPVGANPAEAAREEIRVARQNWKKTLASPEPDRRRQLFWRALHGLLGIEYYDFRWSPVYALAVTLSRLLSPFFILAATSVLFALPWRRMNSAKLAGLSLLFLLVCQNIALGSNPRYVLPFLPVIFLFAIGGTGDLHAGGLRNGVVFAAFFAGLILLAAWQHASLDWQWGRIERAGVTLRQTIPRGTLPPRPPAVLHVRIAPPNPLSDAHLIVSSGGTTLFSSRQATERGRPDIMIGLPPGLLEQNARGPVEISLTSTGNYGDDSYLLFPVIPPPWARTARREGGGGLSPSTGIAVGGLDLWAHAGTP